MIVHSIDTEYVPIIFSSRASLDKKRRDPEFFLDGIRHFGKLFDFDTSEPYDYVGFGQLLQELDTNFNVSAKIREASFYLLNRGPR